MDKKKSLNKKKTKFEIYKENYINNLNDLNKYKLQENEAKNKYEYLEYLKYSKVIQPKPEQLKLTLNYKLLPSIKSVKYISKSNTEEYNIIGGSFQTINFKNLVQKPHTNLANIFNSYFGSTVYNNLYSGIQIDLKGRIKGALRARRYLRKLGNLNQQSFGSNSSLDYSKRDFFTKWGVIGLKVFFNR